MLKPSKVQRYQNFFLKLKLPILSILTYEFLIRVYSMVSVFECCFTLVPVFSVLALFNGLEDLSRARLNWVWLDKDGKSIWINNYKSKFSSKNSTSSIKIKIRDLRRFFELKEDENINMHGSLLTPLSFDPLEEHK